MDRQVRQAVLGALAGLLDLPDGRLLLPSKATDVVDEFRYFGMLRVSHDMGETRDTAAASARTRWPTSTSPPSTSTPSGRLLVLYRGHTGALGPQIVHEQGFTEPLASDPAFMGRVLVLVTADDDGKTWTPWRATRIHGSPAHLLGLRHGCIFLTVGTRWEGQRGCVGRVLEPEGSDLDTAPEFVISNASISADCGYPWSVELLDGRVLVAHWRHFEDDLRGIEAAFLEEE